MAEVRLDRVTKRFGEAAAVRDLTLTVAAGEFVVLLGPTGAGKTTTLRLVAGLETPDTGSVWIDGHDATRLPPAERDVAFVFQQYSLYPHNTAYENLAFPLKAPRRRQSQQAIDRRIREVAAMLRIDSKLGNRVTALSGGEMQRVSIGRALVREPSVFLMDEPLSSLDAKLREDLRVELKRIQRDLGATILYVTHDQLEAMTLADRIGILERGSLIQTGTPRAVYEQPANIYAARRLGSPQINLLKPDVLRLRELPPGTDLAGVRPEDVRLLTRDTPSADGSNARILAVEALGVETVVLLDVAGTEVHALADAHAGAQPGDHVLASVRPGAAIPFAADGRRLAI
jgi:multiple sugar transport system ATP-binding protein